jgi:hypothetical protein
MPEFCEYSSKFNQTLSTNESIRYNDGKLPRDELIRVIERKEESIPYLLEIMNELKEDYEKVIDPSNWN